LIAVIIAFLLNTGFAVIILENVVEFKLFVCAVENKAKPSVQTDAMDLPYTSVYEVLHP